MTERRIEMKVLYHVDERAKWPLVLANVQNMQQYAKEHQGQFLIEIVANSEAVMDLTKENAAPALKELVKARVLVCACNHSLTANHIDAESLISGLRIVPSGVVEAAERQQEGYSYLRP